MKRWGNFFVGRVCLRKIKEYYKTGNCGCKQSVKKADRMLKFYGFVI